jgi:hypothetical protein
MINLSTPKAEAKRELLFNNPILDLYSLYSWDANGIVSIDFYCSVVKYKHQLPHLL